MFVDSVFERLDTVTLYFSYHSVWEGVPYPNQRMKESRKVLSSVDILAWGMAIAWSGMDGLARVVLRDVYGDL